MPGLTNQLENRPDKILIVEGKNDLRVIPCFMEHAGILWPKDDPPVSIKDAGGKPNIPKVVKGTFKSDLWEKVGIIVDADEEVFGTWDSIRQLCLDYFSLIPSMLPDSGHWQGEANGKKLGIWVMPGAKKEGMIEDFLVDCMVHPNENEALWNFAKTSTENAKLHNHKYKKVHQTKAQVHCWLAWQDEPGNQLHEAVKKKLFHPNSGQGPEFVQWFCDLFEPEMSVQAT